jgi:general stress protein 26
MPLPKRSGEAMIEMRRKLWDLVNGCETAVLITHGNDGFIHARTMENNKVTHTEEIWFATEAKERKLVEIAREPRVTAFYTHPDKSWACVYGIAEPVSDQTLKSRLWKDAWERYWPNGPLSENYVLIRIVPVLAEFLLRLKNERGRVAFKQVTP